MGQASEWWVPPWAPGGPQDPDTGWSADVRDGPAWHEAPDAVVERVLAPLEDRYEQFRSRDRVRDLAEVFTHSREVEAMLDQMPDAFAALDVKFLEPTCGSGNFLVAVLRRKLALVAARECGSQEQYEHRLLRAAASVYGVDISEVNVTDARARMGHVLADHYRADAAGVEPTPGFVAAAAAVIAANIVLGDSLADADRIELCDWRPHPGGRFVRVWSCALVPEADRDLFWAERVQDTEPVHYRDLAPGGVDLRGTPTKRGAAR